MAAAASGAEASGDKVLDTYEHKVTERELADRKQKATRQAKIVIVGDPAVGKTSIMTRFCEDQFAKLHIQTIGMDLKTKIVTHDDATTTKLQIWDTPGQDRYYKLARGSMTGTDAVLLVFSFDDRGSWRQVRTWIENVSALGDDTCPIVLCGNKLDIRDSCEDDPEKRIGDSEIKKTADELGCEVMYTSAKTGEGVEGVFLKLAELARARMPHDGRRRSTGRGSGRIGKLGSGSGSESGQEAPARPCCGQ